MWYDKKQDTHKPGKRQMLKKKKNVTFMYNVKMWKNLFTISQ